MSDHHAGDNPRAPEDILRAAGATMVKMRATERQVIRIEAGEPTAIIDAAEQALISAGLPVYQRSGLVVSPATVPVRISGGRVIRAHAIARLTTPAIIEA